MLLDRLDQIDDISTNIRQMYGILKTAEQLYLGVDGNLHDAHYDDEYETYKKPKLSFRETSREYVAKQYGRK